MKCNRCRQDFNEKLGTICPNCSTAHILRDGRVIDVIVTKRCPNCGEKYHMPPSSTTGLTVPKFHCKRCGKIDHVTYDHD